MAKGFHILASGIKDFQGDLRKLPQEVINKVSGEMEDVAKVFVRNAKVDAPKDTAFLEGQISYIKIDELNFQVISGAFQAGFVEFGTKRNFEAIPGFEEEAASIRGIKGGDAEQFLENIKQWVRRKGIRFDSAGTYKSGAKKGTNRQLTLEQTAYIIYHFILLNGIKPHPYFFKHVVPASQELTRKLNAIVLD